LQSVPFFFIRMPVTNEALGITIRIFCLGVLAWEN